LLVNTREFTPGLCVWLSKPGGKIQAQPGYRAMAQHVADDPLEQGYTSDLADAILKPLPAN
jgi:hypothetical protein